MVGDDPRHRPLLDPLHALFRVDALGEVGGEEAIALEPAAVHEGEDAERGVTEAEPLRLPRREEPDHQVDALDAAVKRWQLAVALLFPTVPADQVGEVPRPTPPH